MNDTFVVVDAGGGTVDLISYTVKSIDPLRLEMCVESAGNYSHQNFETVHY